MTLNVKSVFMNHVFITVPNPSPRSPSTNTNLLFSSSVSFGDVCRGYTAECSVAGILVVKETEWPASLLGGFPCLFIDSVVCLLWFCV